VVKLNPTGSALLYSTFLGGNSSEDPLAIAVESSGHAVVVGLTRSEDFPVTPGAFQQTRLGTALHDDGFVVRLTPTGSSAAYSTLLGGSGDDVLFAVRVDAAGNAVIAGDTESANLPIVAGQKPNIDGERDAIVAKFGPTGTAQFVTYLGGSGLESGWAIDVDAAGNIYVAGDTLLGGFPGTRPPIGATGGRDIFVAKLPASGTSITWSVRIGGSGEEIIRDAELDAGNRLHLVGGTSSRDFPVTPDAVQRDTAQGGGLIYAALNATGTALTYGTLLGGESSGFGTAVAIKGDDTWIAGSASPGFPEVNAPGTFGGSSPSGFLARFDWDPPPAVSDPRELVLYAADAENIRGAWRLEPNGGAAGGAHIHQPNAGVPKINSPASDPAHSFELTFTPVAGVAYRLWIRGRADNNSYENDSVWIQFSGSVDASGNAIWRTGTTSATWAGVENCAGCGLSGWGWSDNGYGGFGPVVRFATSEEQTLRVQAREDGISIDQIVLSAARFMTDAPGAPKNDSTILPPSDGTEDEPPSECDPLEIVLHTDAATLAGAWRREADATAAAGTKVRHPNARAPKIAAPLANPTNYVELTFHAEANRDYRLWIRGRADGNSYENDSVYVQFSDSVTAAGAPTWRTGSTSATTYVLEDCGGCHSVGWGWNDNHYGSDRLGTPVRFAATGTHTIRIQTREDGLSIDQIVLSAATYFSAGPGPAIDDATILDTCGE
jgi:hypothetical protein